MTNVYDKRSVVAQYELSRTIPQSILQAYAQTIVDVTHATSMCDVGFGRGSTLIPFSHIIPSTGIDSSLAMCDYVRSTYSSPKLTVIQGDGADIRKLLPLQELVHMKAVLHLQQNPYAFVDSLVDALLPNGYLAVGREVSQPEDNLECIGEYAQNPVEDNILADFYSTYFLFRKNIGKPFVRPVMPAGSLLEVTRYLTSKSLVKKLEFTTQNWCKQITLDELITSMRVGTFSVFSKGLTDEQRQDLSVTMQSYCHSKKYDTKQVRSYDACLECVIFEKKVSTKSQ